MNKDIPGTVIFTYPNIGPFNLNGRGGLNKRAKEVKRINSKYKTKDFKIVEIPADFVKNKSEEKKTGLEIRSMLDQNSVKYLYSKGVYNEDIKYILHTEPVFSRRGLKKSCTTKLGWYNTDWLNKFIKHVFSIIDFLEVSPYAIEIHPGKFERGKNNIKVFSKAIKKINDKYDKKYNDNIFIFVENRTGQYIQNGTAIKDFWEFFKDKYHDLVTKTGIILDIQQFYTVTKDNFIKEFNKIPKDSLFGVHIHERHRTPKFVHIPEDYWLYVSAELKSMGSTNRPFHVLPEVHHANHVEKTYEFCKDVIKLGY
ncbi:MAG: hypothetical protein FJ150_07685 [Euryarchaeota archaeon]|nr:hypothetical protein [Euryarchaeota archaeon]